MVACGCWMCSSALMCSVSSHRFYPHFSNFTYTAVLTGLHQSSSGQYTNTKGAGIVVQSRCMLLLCLYVYCPAIQSKRWPYYNILFGKNWLLRTIVNNVLQLRMLFCKYLPKRPHPYAIKPIAPLTHTHLHTHTDPHIYYNESLWNVYNIHSELWSVTCFIRGVIIIMRN